jgi:hypothetical protein
MGRGMTLYVRGDTYMWVQSPPGVTVWQTDEPTPNKTRVTCNRKRSVNPWVALNAIAPRVHVVNTRCPAGNRAGGIGALLNRTLVASSLHAWQDE